MVLGKSITIVSLGILFKKFGFIPHDVTALSVIVGKCALPAIFFLFAAKLQFGSYNFVPIITLIITRVIMIFIAFLLSLLLRMKPTASYTGIMGIMLTQSNDIALGMPVINALWPNETYHFSDYTGNIKYMLYYYISLILILLCIVIHSTMALFTSSFCIGLMLIGQQHQQSIPKKNSKSLPPWNVQKYKHESNVTDSFGNNNIDINSDSNSDSDSDVDSIIVVNKPGCCKTTFIIIRALLSNAIILGVLSGMILNGILLFSDKQGQIPSIINDTLTSASNCFEFLAYLLMGIGMEGKLKFESLFGRKGVLPIVLVILKLFMMPLIARLVLDLLYPLSGLTKNCSDSIDSTTVCIDENDYENFTFLYASLPPAITPVVLAQSFDLIPNKITNALIISLLVSSPYILGTAVLLSHDNVVTLFEHIARTSNQICSIMSIGFGSLLLSGLIFDKKLRRFPVTVIIPLILCQILFSVFSLPCQYNLDDTYGQYWFYLATVFEWCCHILICIYAVMNVLYKNKPRFVLNHKRLWVMLPITLTSIIGGIIFIVLILFDIYDGNIAEWAYNYNTKCWMRYEHELYRNIIGMGIELLILFIVISLSIYIIHIKIDEFTKIKPKSQKLKKFIDETKSAHDELQDSLMSNHSNSHVESLLKRTSSSLSQQMLNNPNISNEKINEYYTEKFNMDFGFRLQCIIVLEFIRCIFNMIFLIMISVDLSGKPGSSYYELLIFSIYIIDLQGFMTFIAFAFSKPFWEYTTKFVDIITCYMFKFKQNNLDMDAIYDLPDKSDI